MTDEAARLPGQRVPPGGRFFKTEMLWEQLDAIDRGDTQLPRARV